jgi:hypothetical protein
MVESGATVSNVSSAFAFNDPRFVAAITNPTVMATERKTLCAFVR